MGQNLMDRARLGGCVASVKSRVRVEWLDANGDDGAEDGGIYPARLSLGGSCVPAMHPTSPSSPID